MPLLMKLLTQCEISDDYMVDMGGAVSKPRLSFLCLFGFLVVTLTNRPLFLRPCLSNVIL